MLVPFQSLLGFNSDVEWYQALALNELQNTRQGGGGRWVPEPSKPLEILSWYCDGLTL